MLAVCETWILQNIVKERIWHLKENGTKDNENKSENVMEITQKCRWKEI